MEPVMAASVPSEYYYKTPTLNNIHKPISQKKKKTQIINMEIESVRCECCGLKEECSQAYIGEVRSKFEGKWLCGLCSEAVRDEVAGGKLEDAVKAHMSFCGKFRSNPAVRVADGMRQILRRRTNGLSSSSSKKYTRSKTSLY